jgi:hypothetical protein
MSETENKKNATERLEDLEKTVLQINDTLNQIIQALQPLNSMTRDLMNSKEALKLLNNKVDAIVKATNQGTPLSDENLSNIMTENNVQELAGRITKMVQDGVFVASDSVTKDSFVVVNHTSADGKVIEVRSQFLVSALNHEELKGKLEGLKVGGSTTLEDGSSIKVLETYNIVVPEAPAEAPAASSEAPAADQTASAPEASASASAVEPATSSGPEAQAAESAAPVTASA